MDRQANWITFAICVAAALTALPARADMRCGTKLVREGQRAEEVREACGAPTTAERRVERRSYVAVGQQGRVIVYDGEVIVDEWSYDFGPHQFVKYLRFENGTLLSIFVGNYGTSR